MRRLVDTPLSRVHPLDFVTGAVTAGRRSGGAAPSRAHPATLRDQDWAPEVCGVDAGGGEPALSTLACRPAPVVLGARCHYAAPPRRARRRVASPQARKTRSLR